MYPPRASFSIPSNKHSIRAFRRQRGGKDRRGVSFTHKKRVFHHAVFPTSFDRFPLRSLFSRESRYLNLLLLHTLHSHTPFLSLHVSTSPFLVPRFYSIASTYSFMLQLLATSYLDRLASHIASSTSRAVTRRRHILTLSCQR